MTIGEFLSGVGRGAKGAALSTWDGLKAAGQAGWDIVSDAPGAREQFWATTKGVAQAVKAYGEQAYEDPAMVWRDAKEQVGAAWTAGKDFAQNADAGQWGEAVGSGGFTVATAVTGAGVAAKGAQLAGKGAKWVGKAAKAQKRADKAPDAGCGAVLPCKKAMAATKARLKLREDLGPEHFDEKGNLRWPENDGFVSPPVRTTLRPGDLVDRYSHNFGEDDLGYFFSRPGVPYDQRALPYDKTQIGYARYRIVKPFEADSGFAASAFGAPGGGVQYRMPVSTSDLIRDGYIKLIFP